MIFRFWRGWTRPEDADEYAQLLAGTIIPDIFSRNINGLLGVKMLRRDADEVAGEVEFATILQFDKLASVKNFMGEDYIQAHIPAAAQKLFTRWDSTCAHYEMFEA
ncbi:MAG: antibiotic biosynthesis monooxygenase [Litorimonas sp.]